MLTMSRCVSTATSSFTAPELVEVRMRTSSTVPAIKDEEAAHPVATAWRPAIRGVVKALANKDYELKDPLEGVAPVAPTVAAQITEYIEDYGETIIDLPEATWSTSVSQWMGDHWQVLVDLWTAESGESDLVLNLRVFEVGEGFRMEIESVHVP